MPFDDQLRRYRRSLGLTQQELADRSRLSARGIRALEQRERTNPHKDTVRLLAEALALTPEQLLDFERASVIDVTTAESNGKQWGPVRELPIGGFLGALPAGPIIGREAQLHRLSEMADDVSSGLGRLALLRGEPGVGKTRLAQETSGVLRERGFLVAAGRCYESRQSTPYLPFLEALEDVYALCAPAVRERVVDEWPYLSHLLPARRLPLPRSEGTDETERLLRAVSGFATAVALESPLAILLDDLHWSDQTSLDLIQHLTRQTRGSRVLLIGACREGEVGRSHRLSKVLRDLNKEQLVETLRVQCLPADASAELIRATMGDPEIGDELTNLIFAKAEGHPFYTVEILRDLTERGDLFRLDQQWRHRTLDEIAIPETIRDAIGERVGHLTSQAQTLLDQASVLGQTFTFAEINAVSDHTEDIEDLIHEVVSAGIIVDVGDDRYAFDHALTQQTLYAGLSPRRRRRVHLAAAESFEALPASERRATDLAHHFSKAGDRPRALLYSVEAGDQAEDLFAHGEAEVHYRLALDLARAGEDASEARLLEKLGRVMTNVGRFGDARSLLEMSMLRCELAGDEDGVIQAAVQLGALHHAAGSPAEGITMIQELTRRLEQDDRAAAAVELYIVLETLLCAIGRHEEGLAAATRGADLARAAGDQGALGRAEVGRGAELGSLRRVREALAVLEAAIPVAEAAGDIYNLSRAFDYAAAFRKCRGEFKQASHLASRNLDVQQRGQNPWGIAMAHVTYGGILGFMGEWSRARDHFDQAEAMTENLGFSSYSQYCMVEMGEFRIDEGRLDDARMLAEEALAATRSTGDLGYREASRTLLARLDLLEGRPEQARGRIEPFQERPEFATGMVTRLLPTLAMAQLDCGDHEAALATVDEAIQLGQQSEHRLVEAEALAVRGALMSRREAWVLAERDLRSAAQMAAAMPYPHLQARALYEQGLMHCARAEPHEAREHLRESLAIFQRLGAQPYVERASRALNDIRSTN